jgi:5-methylcytosine-specific restriction protein A
MSTRRVAAEAGWVHGPRPTGPTGRPLCRRCEQECPRGRRTFCSDACVDAWMIRTSPSHVRTLVLRRDQGVCAECGLDCCALEREFRRVKYPERGQRLRALGIPPSRTTFWDADHIVPVVEGGGECDLDNYRTLCIPCHRRATAALRRRLAETRAAVAEKPAPAPIQRVQPCLELDL